MSALLSPKLGDPGPLVLATDVDDAVLDVLRMWLPTFLRIVVAERELPALPAPQTGSYASTFDDDEWLDRAAPGILATTAETASEPVRLGDGTYTVAWRVTVSAVVRGRMALESRHNAAMYEGAVRRALAHRGTSSALIRRCRWQGASVAPVARVSSASRYLAAGTSRFLITTDRALGDIGGPRVPDLDPYTPTATITDVRTTVEGFAPGQEGGPR